MSRIDDSGQTGPSPDGTEPTIEETGGSEPRLLTRPVQPEVSRRGVRSSNQSATDAATLAKPSPPERNGQRVPRQAGQRQPTQLRWILTDRRAWWAVRLVAVAGALILIVALVAVLDLRHALKASLPQLDGEVHVVGLHAPVSVSRNAQGVPSISAASLEDLLFAQGYVTASDRLWQMDGLRRHAAGELAEVLGPGLVAHDRRQRYLQMRAAADRAVAALPRDEYAQLEAYARGVNAYIEAHRGALPMEFRLLAYKPTPWSPRDSLLVSLAIYQDMSTGFPQKMNREALRTHLPDALVQDLYPVGSWRDLPPAAQGRNITEPHEVEQIPLDPSQSGIQKATPLPRRSSPGDLLAVSTGLAGAGRCEGCRAGSNNWAVSGAHTASGGPLVSNDMHLNLGIPDVWYEASLHTGLPSTGTSSAARLDVAGFTLPGVPFVIVGRNTHLAWGLTNLGADVQDLRVEHLRGAGSHTEYQRPDGSWLPVNHRAERIVVRGGRDVTLDVLTTVHAVGDMAMETPIISPLYPSETRALSLAWTAYDPGTVTSPFLDINAAADGASLVTAFASFGGPSLNLVWADDRNHIGYHALGRIPIRGPAVQRPRPVTPVLAEPLPGKLPPVEGDAGPADTAPTGASDQPDGDENSPQAALRSAPHVLLSAYHLGRRHTVKPHPQRAATREGRAATRDRRSASPAARATRRKARLAARKVAESPSAPVVEASIPAPQPLNYTVGSPISPVPVDASDASQEWSGYIAFGDLPAVTDPANGLLATANSRITPDDYPWAVANDWTDPFRTERIVSLLTGRTGLKPADMLRFEMDIHSDVDQAIAQRLAYALDHASAKSLGKDAKRLRQAADLLRNWNGDLTADSAPGAIVSAVRTQLWPALLIPPIMTHDGSRDAGHDSSPKGADAQVRQAADIAMLYTWGERTTAIEVMLQNQPARWLPRPYTRWSDFLTAVTEVSLQAAHAPGDLQTWRYGEQHTVEIAHPLLGDQSLLSRLLGIQGTTGARPSPGDGTTIRQIGSHFGPSERFTADLSSPTAAYANITTGQSGDGVSPWYLDQFQPWLTGSTFAMPLAGDTSPHTLRLLPQ